MTTEIDEYESNWLATPDTKRAKTVTKMIGYPYCETEPATFVLSQTEIAALFKFWEITQFEWFIIPQLLGYGMSGSQHRKCNLMAVRRNEFAKVIGEEAAEKAAKEAYEDYLRKQPPEMKAAYDAGGDEWLAYVAKMNEEFHGEPDAD